MTNENDAIDTASASTPNSRASKNESGTSEHDQNVDEYFEQFSSSENSESESYDY
jgi:hypothetical protein